MKKSITLLALLPFIACAPKEEKKKYHLIEKASWFLGEWENKSKMGDFTEKWEKLSDSTFMGESYIIQGKDTIFHENVLLEQRTDSLFYNVSVNGNKGDDTTSFYLTSSMEDQLVFENPKHDFPTKIVYNMLAKDSLLASIHGKEKGVDKVETFPMVRKK